MKLLKQSKRAQVIAALVEGHSVRATVRMTDASKNAIQRLNRNCNTGSDGQAENSIMISGCEWEVRSRRGEITEAARISTRHL